MSLSDLVASANAAAALAEEATEAEAQRRADAALEASRAAETLPPEAAPPRQQWEACMRTVACDQTSVGAECARMGDDGWALVAANTRMMVWSGSGHPRTGEVYWADLFFRRPKES